MMISLCHTPQTGTWIGSTPEIILSGQDTEWHTVALAGTMPMQGEIMPTEWSEKNQNEQAFVKHALHLIFLLVELQDFKKKELKDKKKNT